MKRYLITSILALMPVAAMAQGNMVSVEVPVDVPVMPQPQGARTLFIDDQRMLMQAADSNDAARIREFVNFNRAVSPIDPSAARRVNLEFTDQQGNTPLIRAAARGHLEAVQELVAGGANLNAQNARWETPLISSYNNGYFKVTRYLLAQGAADPYNAAELMARSEAIRTAQLSSQTRAAGTSNVVYAGGAIAAAGAVGLAIAGSSGGGSGGSGSGDGVDGGGDLALDCGAGTSTHPEACDSADFVTAEAAQQEGVLAMNADHALSHGYDGRIFDRDVDGDLLDDVADGNVLVAVIDSGVDLDHEDLLGNIRTDLAVTCTNTSGCLAGGADEDGHGTNVAGIIAARRNGVGMHGVAPEAHVVPIAAIIDNGATTYAFQYANDINAQVINNSWGAIYSNDDQRTIPIIDATGPNVAIYHPTGDYDALTPAQLRSQLTIMQGGTNDEAELQAAVAAHRIIVFAAGNDALDQVGFMAGLPYYFQGATAPSGLDQGDYDIVNPSGYDWSRNWVAAISLADNGNISSFSHQCGVAKNWCLAAPGEVASTTKDGGGYEANNGTSFAAPNVSGAIAVMLGAYPHLDPEDVLEILFDTATDLGDAGIDDVYGRGLVNLQKATDPTEGGWTLSVSGGVSGSSFSFAGSGFGLSPAFGNALAKSQIRLMFQDAYNKDYTVPLSLVAGRLENRQTIYERMDAFGEHGFDQVVSLGENAKIGFSAAQVDPIPDRSANKPFGSVSYQSQMPLSETTKLLVATNYRTNMAEAMLPLEHKDATALGVSKNPYLKLVGSATGTTLGYSSGNITTKIAAFNGSMQGETSEAKYRFGSEKNASGFVSATRYDVGASGIELENGVTIEENSFLGSETSGAFGIDRASTYFTGLKGRWGLANDLMLFGMANFGYTKLEAANASMFNGFGGALTNSFALGVEKSGAFHPADRLGLVFSQPLRVMKGAANLILPSDIATDKSVIFSSQRLNLAPKGRELDLETYYNVAASDKHSLSINALFRMEPDNDNTAPNDLTLLGKYRWVFN